MIHEQVFPGRNGKDYLPVSYKMNPGECSFALTGGKQYVFAGGGDQVKAHTWWRGSDREPIEYAVTVDNSGGH
nr:hypothetical protein [uncultured Rhodopila sp.]